MTTVRLEMSGHGRGEVFVDGVAQEHVTAVDLSLGVDETNKIIITQLPEQVIAELGVVKLRRVHADIAAGRKPTISAMRRRNRRGYDPHNSALRP